jgi:ubiquinone/menaquinone biosynthesis C-methylase UbiE
VEWEEAPPEAPAPGAKPPRGSPVVWTRSAGRGRVAVIAVALDAGAPGPGPEANAAARALDLLAARAVEWAAGKEITTRIPPGLPLLAARLGPLDAGTLPGLPAAPGFHRGREIAAVMGFQAIDWLLRADREATELPEKVLDSLGIEEGSTAADVGAGAGYFTFRLARRVGPHGKVIATDIQEEMLSALRERMAAEGVANVEPVLATEDDPGLPAGAVDFVLLVDVYHELAKPAELLRAVARSLRPPAAGRRRARLVLVEYRGEDPSVPIKPLHRMTVDQARAEVEPAGFRWVETKDFLPHQHILVFEGR